MKLVLTSAVIEFGKIFTRKKFYVLLLIQLFICAATVFFTSANGFKYFGMSVDLPSVPYIFLNGLVSVVLPLLVFMICTDLFAHELEDLSIKAILLRPISRFKVYTSKFLAIVFYVALNLMATFLLVVTIKIILSGDVSDFSGLFSAYFLSIFTMLAFISLGIFLSLLIGHPAMAMFCSFILYIAAYAITIVSPQIGAMFFTSHLEWYKMFAGISFDSRAASNILNTFLLFTSYTVLLGIGGIVLLERKEL